MKYSFVIPVFRDECIYAAVDSFISATDSEKCECLIVCDGSEHMAQSLLDKYKRVPNIRLVYLDVPNLAYARSVGVLKASGEYIVWTDSDCIIDPTYISRLYNSHKDENIIRGNLIFLEGSTRIERANAWLRSQFLSPSVDWCWTPNLVIRRNIYDIVGLYDDAVSGAEDGEWDWRAREKNYHAEKYDTQLIMRHHEDRAPKIFSSWLRYGKGRAYRMKRDRHVKGSSYSSIVKNVFSGLSFVKAKNGVINNAFLISCVLVEAASFAVSWIVQFSAISSSSILEKDSYLKSEMFKNELIKRTKDVK